MKHYEDFYFQVDTTITKKTDNLRMLLANVKVKIAKKHELLNHNYDALNQVDLAL